MDRSGHQYIWLSNVINVNENDPYLTRTLETSSGVFGVTGSNITGAIISLCAWEFIASMVQIAAFTPGDRKVCNCTNPTNE